MAVEPALQFGKDLRDGFGRTGRGRDQRLATGTRPAKILVAPVDDRLGVGDVVDRRHAAMLDTDLLLHHLDDGCKAVGRAGCGCYEVICCRIIPVVVDAVDDVQRTLGRCGNDNLLHALIEIGLQGLRLLVMLACRLDDDVTAGPVGLTDAGTGGVADGLAVDEHMFTLGAGLRAPGAVNRIEFQQMRGAGRIGCDLVDMREFKLWPAPAGTHPEAAHSTKTVDTNRCRHKRIPDESVYEMRAGSGAAGRARAIRHGLERLPVGSIEFLCVSAMNSCFNNALRPLREIRLDAIIGPEARLAVRDNAGLAQGPEVMGDLGLLEFQGICQLTDAQLPVGCQQDNGTQPGRIGERLEKHERIHIDLSLY